MLLYQILAYTIHDELCKIHTKTVPFSICISEINKTQVNDAHDINVVMSTYNLIEYSDIY